MTKVMTTPRCVASPENEGRAFAGLSRVGGDGIEPPTSCL
jgi:hypothetical protein